MPFFISQKKIEKEIANRVSESCEQVINEMGAEIHDDLIQKLSIFSLYMDRIERASSHPMEIEALVIKMRGEFKQLANVVRSISRRLMPARREGDTFINTVQILCQNMEHSGTGHIHFNSEGTPNPLTLQVEIYLLRIIQELVYNAFRHSSAWHVWVRVNWGNELLKIEVEDDGSGFAKIQEFKELLKTKHNTLKMRSIVIGGSLSYHQGANGLLARVELKQQK